MEGLAHAPAGQASRLGTQAFLLQEGAGSLPQEAQPWLLGLRLFAPGHPPLRVTCCPQSVRIVHANLESTSWHS